MTSESKFIKEKQSRPFAACSSEVNYIVKSFCAVIDSDYLELTKRQPCCLIICQGI